MSPALLGDFGPIVLATDIDEAIIDVLAKWLPTYLGQIERERGLAGQLPRPGRSSYANTLESMEFLDHHLPAVIVTTAPTTGKPARHADGTWGAVWRVNVNAILRGGRPPETRTNAALFEGSIRRLLLQQVVFSTAVKFNSSDWVSSAVQPVADTTGRGRYLAAGLCSVDVSVQESVKDGDAYPITPDATYVPPDGSTAGSTTVSTEVDGVGITQPLGG